MKKLTAIFMIIIIMISTTSCQGTKQELDHLSVVLAMGFDLTSENKYLLSFQVLNSKKQPTFKNNETTKEQFSSDVLTYKMDGNTPNEAIDKLSTEIGRNLFFGHTKYIVVGENLARYGLSFFTDVVLRGYESRPSNLLLVTKGNALDVISTSTSSDSIPANTIESLKRQQSTHGYAPIVSRIDFANALSHKTLAPIIGVVEIVKNQTDNTFKFSGTAVFKKDKLVGYLDMAETQGMQWIKGKVQNTIIPTVLDNDGFITFDVLKAKSKVTAEIIGDTVKIHVNIKEQGNIVEMSPSINVMESPWSMIELSKLKKAAIESRIKSAINKAQKDLKADIFDFGGVVYKKNPNFWKTIEDDWDEIFPTIDVTINVDSKLKRPGIINKPIS